MGRRTWVREEERSGQENRGKRGGEEWAGEPEEERRRGVGRRT